MRKESFAEKFTERLETQEIIEKAYKELPENIKAEAEYLRSEGFLVDDEMRIKYDDFDREDIKEVERLEKLFNKNSEAAIRGEVLEMTKTLLFNKELFGGKLIAVRTCKYDDYKNGVDQIIFNTETFEPIAAVDTTTNWTQKSANLIEKIKDGCKVKYGLSIGPKGVQKTKYENLPMLIISISPEKLAEFSTGIVEGSLNEDTLAKLESSLLDSFQKQFELSPIYQKTGEVFKRFIA